jgi:pimeloyl-ACP methyl ester carboxylesterase
MRGFDMRLRLLPFALLLISAPASAATLDWHACHVEKPKVPLRCATFHVPENRSMANGRVLPLEVIIIPAHDKPAKEPIFFLSGGPGEAVTAVAPFITPDAWQVKTHDVVLMDMRGTGEGNRLDCSLGGSDADIQEYLEPLFHDGARYGECAKALSARADLTQYTTPNSVQDLDDLREALGYGQIDIDAGSYGTRAALVYMHMFPTRVHTAILSGIDVPENHSPLNHAAAAERAMETLFAQCAAAAACHKTFLDPKGDLDAILAALRTKPATVTVTHPVTKKPTAISLTASGFADGLRVMLYSEEEGRKVPLLLARARAGDYTPFAEAALANNRGLKLDLAMGLLLSVSCSEDTNRIDPALIAKAVAGSFIGDWRVKGQMAACSAWPTTHLPADYFAPFTVDTPILLVSGNLDPVTPPHWGDVAKRYFPKAVHVVMPGAHVAGNDCVDAMTKALFEPATPTPSTHRVRRRRSCRSGR